MARRRLTVQQKARIAKIQERRRQKATSAAESSLQQVHTAAQREGRVVVRHGRNLLIREPSGDTVHGLFRANLGEVVCGDRVIWQPTADGEGVVVAVQPRDTALTRPGFDGREKAIAANITQLVVVLAVEPEPAGYLLDQYLVAAQRAALEGLICLNKADLLDQAGTVDFVERFSHYERIGYPVILISAKTEHGLDSLLQRLNRQTSILVGQSGVGKSSLVNTLLPDQDVLEGKLSDATGLGRHTTSAATLYPLACGGEMIDSPGVRSFRLGQLTRYELERGFREFLPFLGQCRFHNCAHLAEPGCAIQQAVDEGLIAQSRIDSYRHMATALPGGN
jgi:ribosome biogenesis GTPase